MRLSCGCGITASGQRMTTGRADTHRLQTAEMAHSHTPTQILTHLIVISGVLGEKKDYFVDYVIVIMCTSERFHAQIQYVLPHFTGFYCKVYSIVVVFCYIKSVGYYFVFFFTDRNTKVFINKQIDSEPHTHTHQCYISSRATSS